MCITHLIIINEMLFFLILFTCVETKTKRSYFFSKVVHTVGRWPRLVQTSDSGSGTFPLPLLPGACVQLPDTWDLKKTPILSCMLSWHFILFLCHPWLHHGVQCISGVLVSSQPPSLRPYHPPISICLSPQLTYIVTKSPCLLLFSVQAALQSFTAATRTPLAGKTVEFQKCELLLLILKTKNIFLYTFRNISIWIIS